MNSNHRLLKSNILYKRKGKYSLIIHSRKNKERLKTNKMFKPTIYKCLFQVQKLINGLSLNLFRTLLDWERYSLTYGIHDSSSVLW